MVMRIMLMGLLVIGTVSMLETHVNAAGIHVNAAGINERCCWCSKLCMEFLLPEKSETVIAEVAAEVKKHEGSEVWLIGFTDQKSPEEYRSMESKIEVVQLLLKQHGLQPDIIRSLVLGGYAPLDPKQRGIKAIVTWPKR